MKASVSDSFLASKARLKRARALLFGLASGQLQGGEAKLPLPDERDEFAQLEELLNGFAAEFLSYKDRNRELELERLQLIAAQQAALDALSVPIIDVWTGVLVLPLIGPVDAPRAQEITQRLLEHIQQSRTRHIIVDVTGVREMSPSLLHALSRLFGAVSLLGARGMLTGIGPDMARRIVDMQTPWQVTTFRTLHEALRMAIAADHDHPSSAHSSPRF